RYPPLWRTRAFVWLLFVAPLVFRAPSGPAAVCAGGRRPARELRPARRLEARPGPAAAPGSVGDSGETVIAFAGACSVSGETDGTIASQIHPFSAVFH
ncbi:hypothetical protein, partial [Actinomyces sp. ICM54]|uniref:hypothetical protein n=1 Tax=Actinomyces sp. ICM54 TaxID=936549 RepID=UPI001E4425D4